MPDAFLIAFCALSNSITALFGNYYDVHFTGEKSSDSKVEDLGLPRWSSG